MEKRVKVSVVVPAFNEEQGLEGSLRSIRAAMGALDRAGWDSALIVCDNNSTDRTAAIAQAMGADVVFEAVNQISRARNTGAARATGDWLVFVDADSQPSAELFADVVRVVQQGRAIAGGSTVQLDTGELAPRLAVGSWNLVSRAMKWAAGSFIFCDAAAFREIGGFSLELYASEEIDLFRRLKRLARREGRTIVILHEHPLVTSARKAKLYTPREGLAFIVKTLVTRGRTLRNPGDCFQWYDGKR
jgi:glycosyltransferase involved in cell wall biosynthesis